ncbi:hypothetical protein [Streptomyces sp. H51]|uniref:hypothetical protein n=1 Tax=Streptomyces sp. H51 TaxID=3111770 RepID=UPI003B63F908
MFTFVLGFLSELARETGDRLDRTLPAPRLRCAVRGWRRRRPFRAAMWVVAGGVEMAATGDYAGFERLHDRYEKEMFACDPANRRVAAATFRLITGWFPRPLRPLVARVAPALLDEPLLAALGFRPQPRRLRTAAHRTLRAHAALVRRLPPRPDWLPYRTKPRSYPFGWALDDLGPHRAHSRPLTPLPEETSPQEQR